MKTLKVLVWLIMCSAIISSRAAAAEPHQHHRVGSHGMVLLTDGQQLFASHLPLYRRPHDFQIVYQIQVGDHQNALIDLALKGMVTLLPEQFDLDRLVAGESITLTTQFYQDHFERGGTKWRKSFNVAFLTAKYLRPLADIAGKDDDAKTVYQRISVGNGQQFLLIREIQAAPSADHLLVVEVSDTAQCQSQKLEPLSFDWQKTSLESQGRTLRQDIEPCYKVLDEYWETADFARK